MRAKLCVRARDVVLPIAGVSDVRKSSVCVCGCPCPSPGRLLHSNNLWVSCFMRKVILTDDVDSSRSADSCSMMFFVDFHCFVLIFVESFLLSMDCRPSGPPVPMGPACLSARS